MDKITAEQLPALYECVAEVFAVILSIFHAPCHFWQ